MSRTPRKLWRIWTSKRRRLTFYFPSLRSEEETDLFQDREDVGLSAAQERAALVVGEAALSRNQTELAEQIISRLRQEGSGAAAELLPLGCESA